MDFEENGLKASATLQEENGKPEIRLNVEGLLTQNGVTQESVLTQMYDKETHHLLSETVVSKLVRPVQAVITTELLFSPSSQKLVTVSNSFTQKAEEERNLKRMLKFDEAGHPRLQNFILLMGETECKIYESWDDEGTVTRKVFFKLDSDEPQENYVVTVHKDGTILNEKIDGENVIDFLSEIGKPKTTGALMNQFPVQLEDVLQMNKDIKEQFKPLAKKAMASV